MTANIYRTPNHLHVSGDRGYDALFGELVQPIQAVSYNGNGHRSFYIVRFAFGLKLELCPHTAVGMSRELLEAIAANPLREQPIPDVSGAATRIEDQ